MLIRVEMDYKKIITIEHGKKAGKTCIRGMRKIVAEILGYLAAVMSIEEIIEEWPELTKEDIYAALSYSSDMQQKSVVALS